MYMFVFFFFNLDAGKSFCALNNNSNGLSFVEFELFMGFMAKKMF